MIIILHDQSIFSQIGIAEEEKQAQLELERKLAEEEAERARIAEEKRRAEEEKRREEEAKRLTEEMVRRILENIKTACWLIVLSPLYSLRSKNALAKWSRVQCSQLEAE